MRPFSPSDVKGDRLAFQELPFRIFLEEPWVAGMCELNRFSATMRKGKLKRLLPLVREECHGSSNSSWQLFGPLSDTLDRFVCFVS